VGFKKVKEHYKINHIVCMTDKVLCIGSPYIHNIMVIRSDGEIIKKYDGRGNDDLNRYQREMLADKEKLAALIAEPDTFEKSLPVYTYEGGEIIEKHCEEYGWPNLTHDGELMYDNTFFADRSKAIEKAIENAECGVKCYSDKLDYLRDEIEKTSKYLDIEFNNLLKLRATALDNLTKPRGDE